MEIRLFSKIITQLCMIIEGLNQFNQSYNKILEKAIYFLLIFEENIPETAIFLICDLMGQNQSHVAIFSYGVKYTSF